MEELKTFEQFLEKWGEEQVILMKERLSHAGKGGGDLSRSIKLDKVSNKNGKYTFKYTMLKYGIFVDKGRKKGKMPPINSIKKWCERKGINKRYAFPIAREIGRTGIYGINFTRGVSKIDMKDLTKIKEQYAIYVKEYTINALNNELKNKK